MIGRTTARRRAERGYTMVELMMALAIFLVSVLGIVTMQKVTAASNAHAKSTAMARQVAAAWAAQLEMDATLWQTNFAGNFLNGSGQWQRPAYSAARQFGAAFDALGSPLTDSAGDIPKARFCTNLRLSWIYPNGTGVSGNGTLRAEIRVFWLRDNAVTTLENSTFCREDGAQTAKLGFSSDIYQFIYETVGVRQHARI